MKALNKFSMSFKKKKEEVRNAYIEKGLLNKWWIKSYHRYLNETMMKK